MLTVSGLHAHYGLSHVIQGIDLEARPGEVVGIFGRNGVGKTTLLKTIVGWIKPTSGEIRLGGERLDGREPDAICHIGVGFVPEDRRIFPGLTVQENLELGFLQVQRRPGRESRAALERVYDRFPRLGERRKQLGTTLSGGEQQMLAIARVMVGKPKLVLVDEPSEGLAPMIVAEIFAVLRDLRESGAIVLLVEQNVHEALSLADRFYAVERGRIVLEGMAESPSDRERLMATISV
jgi:branched-chain amino acid transport system ATP-binding protein